MKVEIDLPFAGSRVDSFMFRGPWGLKEGGIYLRLPLLCEIWFHWEFRRLRWSLLKPEVWEDGEVLKWLWFEVSVGRNRVRFWRSTARPLPAIA